MSFSKLKKVSSIKRLDKVAHCNLCINKIATKYCEICHEHEEGFLCDDCAGSFHSYSKKKEHSFINIDQYLSLKPQINYSCGLKAKIHFFCEICSTFICNICFKDHYDHKIRKFLDIQEKMENISQNILKETKFKDWPIRP